MPDDNVARALPIDLDVVAGRVDRREVRARLDVHGDGDVPDRLCRELLGVQRVPHFDQVVVFLADVLVGDEYFGGLVWFQGEGPGPVEPETRVFQQCRILLLGDDRFVDSPGLVGLEQPGLELLPVDYQRHGGNGRIRRRWEEILHLDHAPAGVDEFLVDGDRGDLVSDLYVDVVVIYSPMASDPQIRSNGHDHAVAKARGCKDRQNQRRYDCRACPGHL